MRRLLLSLLMLLAPLLPGADALADDRLPAYLLELPESVGDVFIADAANATIYRFARTPAGISLANQGYVSIGQNGVGKQRAGDRKTPLGIYFVVDQLDTSRMHEQYGVTAFPLDYPNVLDRRRERGGDGIWVHGVEAGNGQRSPLATDGCLALPNTDLLALEQKLVPLVTPVIVTRDMEWQEPAMRDALRVELRGAVEQWADALAANDVHTYLSMYAGEFSYRGIMLSEWASFQVQTLERRGEVDVTVDDLLLLAEPEEKELYLSRFRQTMTEGETTSVTTKRLYWKRNAEGKLKIIAEDNG
ncbi:MAG: L,D-transpeptidase family protein [Gammaproteobacteria bacterium]|nr:L,D-transpeptidase family protein [Gammaproteobacteria bacterium]